MVKTLVHMFLAAPVLAVDASCAGESCTVEQYSLLQKGIHASEKGSIDCLSSKCEPLPPKKGCETFFGRGAASHDQIISIVDPDVPALFCDLFKQKAPCTFIHRAQAAGDSNCVSPTPPDKCHQYIKVTYSKCDGLEAIKAGTVDVTGIFDPQTGVFKGCEGNVTSTDYTYWAPNKPISDQPPPTFPETYEAIKCSQPVVAVQDSWDHHFTAFGGQNLDEIVKDYSDDAEINIVNWVDGSMQTFRGLEGVRKAFAELFAQMTDLSDLGAPVVQVDEQKGSVFLIWKNPASGYQYGTDSFMVNSEGKFVRQHVVVSKLGSDAAAAVVPDPAKDGLPTHSAWKRHFAAFGSQSLDDIVVDYSEDAKVNVFNQADGVLTTYNGHSGVRDCFTELFANLHDTSDLAAPIQVVEEAAGNRPGRVLLLWSCPASGYLNGTDTFVTNQEGKFTQQNVVVNYQRKTPPPTPVVAVQDSWDHHFTAFGAQDLDEIVKDYSDDAEINIVNWVDGSMQTFRGLDGVREAFTDLFAQMTDLTDLKAPVIEVDEQKGSVFLIWKNPASGFKYGTDSFMVNSEGKFVRQHVVVSKLGSDAAAAVVPDPAKEGLPTHSAWKRHFAAFGSQSLDDIVVDYSEDAKVNVFNQADGVLTTYNGHSGVRDCFTELFENLHDMTGVTAPIQVVEEAADNRPGRVLLLWSAPASGYMHGTDTFVTNQEGKFTQQNVVVNYQRTATLKEMSAVPHVA